MHGRESLSWATTALALVVLVTACAGRRGDDAAAENGPGVPVVTSIVGLVPASGSTTTSAPGTTGNVRTSTTVSASFGESDKPITVPSSAPAVLGPTAPAAENAAGGFLRAYWAPGARTYAQTADALAPYATDKVLAVYRNPALADKAVQGSGVGEITVQATEATATTAVVVGKGIMVDEPDRRAVYRTLTLVLAPDGAWRVDTVK
jgi:hypothetical protein